MDQKKIGGVGNIYANEALFCAGIRPDRPAKEISNDQLSIFKLYKCLKSVINKGIEYGGATASDDSYVNAAGLAGKYQEHFLVYEQAGKQCSKCRAKIKKVKLGGRGTYFCPRCQR
jgi:formamidopyrimidine-DNA glycosylase